MNWIGGARNRVKFRGERKVQQEFFEKQKMAAASNLLSKKRKHLSQDLVALHTVSKVHSRSPAVPTSRRFIKNLDLEKFHSCTHHIDEVDMGPCSPTATPSKLHLNNGQTDKIPANSCSDGFLKPTEIKINTSEPTTETNRPQNQTRKLKAVEVPDKENEKSVYKSYDDYKTDFTDQSKASCEFSFSKNKPNLHGNINETKRKFDLFVSEDFQMTPLARYEKMSQLMLKQDNKYRKKHHHKLNNGFTSQLHPHRNKPYSHEISVTDDKRFCTSTPLNEGKKSIIIRSNDFSPIEQSFKSVDDISPIMRETKYPETIHDDFQFKPRYMYASLEHSQSDKDGSKSRDHSSKLLLSESIFHEKFLPERQSVPSTSEKYTNKDKGKSYYEQRDFKTPVKQIQKTEYITPWFISEENVFKQSGSNLCEDFQHNLVTSNAGSPVLWKHGPSSCGYSEVINTNAGTKDQNQGQQYLTRGNSFEGIQKPFNSDIVDDYEYQLISSKRCQAVSQPKHDIMNLYKNSDEENSSGQSSSRTDSRQVTDGSVQIVNSPIPADVFPEHLVSPSSQIGEKITNNFATTDNRMQVGQNIMKKSLYSQSSQKSSFSQEINTKSHLEDLLIEMKHLEDQSSGSQTGSCSNVICDCKPVPSETVATDSQEADIVVEMENKLLQSDLEHFSLQKEDTEKTDAYASKHIDRDVLTNHEMRHTGMEQSKSSCKTLSEGQLDHSDINCNIVADRMLFQSKIVAAPSVKSSFSLQKDVREKKPESNVANFTDCMTEVNFDLIHHSKAVKNKTVNDKRSPSETQLNNISVETSRFIQQTEQMSCVDISTQTIESSPKLFRSIGTSSWYSEEWVQQHSVGIQCDLRDVPTLASLCIRRKLWNSSLQPDFKRA